MQYYNIVSLDNHRGISTKNVSAFLAQRYVYNIIYRRRTRHNNILRSSYISAVHVLRIIRNGEQFVSAEKNEGEKKPSYCTIFISAESIFAPLLSTTLYHNKLRRPIPTGMCVYIYRKYIYRLSVLSYNTIKSVWSTIIIFRHNSK